LIKKNGLAKFEILRAKTQIDSLFSGGKAFNAPPIRVYWMEHKDFSDVPAKVIFSVSKRFFKKAVDRNKLKRRMREAYRLNKITLTSALELKNKRIYFMLSYIGNEMKGYREIEDKICQALKRIADVC
jgi:ribonuclease P protein component